jgi:hypothetical protein
MRLRARAEGNVRRKKRFLVSLGISVGALALSAYGLYRVEKLDTRLSELDDRMSELGGMLNETVAALQRRERDDLMRDAVSGIASDWAIISRTAHTPIGFWSETATKEIIGVVNPHNAHCYLLPRVLESIAEVRLLPDIDWPIIRLEVRIPTIRFCGRYGRDLQHVGVFTDQGYGRLEIPVRGLAVFSDLHSEEPEAEALIGVARGECHLMAMNTYNCSVPDRAARAYPNNTCGKVNQPPRACKAVLRRFDAPCWAELASNEDADMHILSTNCPSYTVHGANQTTVYHLKSPAQVAVQLGPGETLVAGNKTVSAANILVARTQRAVRLEEARREPRHRPLATAD